MAVSPIHFIDYSKISDVLMWFDNTHVLKFCVNLQRRDKKGDIVPFHREYTFINKSNNMEQITINREYSFYFIIEDLKNKGAFSANNNNAILRPNDVEFLKMLLKNKIYPWYSSDKIFGLDKDNRIFVKGSITEQFPLSNKNFLQFRPMVIEFENTFEQKPGARLTINDANNYIDITIDKLMEFGYFINNTDMTNAAMNMLTYVKVKPYGEGLIDINNRNNNTGYVATTVDNGSKYTNSGNKKGFF